MRSLTFALAISLLAGCSTTTLDPATHNQQTAQTATINHSGFTQPKVQQWFSTETPETLPPDKIKKLGLGVGGFSGAY